jgi:hypothetical protein
VVGAVPAPDHPSGPGSRLIFAWASAPVGRMGCGNRPSPFPGRNGRPGQCDSVLAVSSFTALLVADQYGAYRPTRNIAAPTQISTLAPGGALLTVQRRHEIGPWIHGTWG